MRTNVDIPSLQNNKPVFFGPFIGELGWELFRWSGFIRWLKKKYPKKEMVVATRLGREDLYYNTVSKVHTFNIQGDYKQYKPNMYRLDGFPIPKLNQMIESYKQQYKNWTFVEPPINTNNRNVFRHNIQHFGFGVHPNNNKLVQDIIAEAGTRIPIALSPRKRNDLAAGGRMHNRNWAMGNWELLFDMIEQSGDYYGIVMGKFPTFIRPSGNMKNLIVLEDYVKGDSVTDIGATIATLKQVSLTIGQHSAIPLLSNYLRTPTLMWGEDRHRHTVLENPFKTTCLFIDDKKFNISPTVVFNYLKRISGRSNS